MIKFKKLYNIYQQDGLRAVIDEVGMYTLMWCPLAPYLKYVFGSRLHHRLYMYFRLGYWPHIQQPRSFNENIIRRKLYTNKDLFSTVSDKWQVRKYVSNKVDKDILTKIHHVTEDPETIPFDHIPEECVIKPTHMSGPIIFIEKQEKPDPDSIKESCREWLAETYGQMKEEYWYEQITPRIVIEERLRGKDRDSPYDYKFFVFHGKVEYIQVDSDRYTTHKRRFYDKDWNPQDFELKFPLGPVIDKPKKLDEMINIAEKLGEDFDFIRVDLYEIDSERIVFGELTLAPGSGGERFRPREYDFKLGSLW